jgi:8-oxo-dGTP pyrophosphatase MutT (NUDIX family)
MLDEEKNFAGVAAKELKEECGLEITSEEMQHLG